MDHTLQQDAKVKEITVGNGCLNIDLSSGLRLSGPLVSSDEAVPEPTRMRRMIVSGHQTLGGQGFAFS